MNEIDESNLDTVSSAGSRESHRREVSPYAISDVSSFNDSLPPSAGRESILISIKSITVKDLPTIHKFTKNYPWLKVTFGDSKVWKTEISLKCNENATTATWENLEMKFLLSKNNLDSNNLSINVCSKKIVLGKYTLFSKYFHKLPDLQETEYFEVNGKLVNALGQAGSIEMICRQSAYKQTMVLSTKIQENLNSTMGSYNSFDIAYLKIVKVILSDLASVHNMSRNSPYLKATCQNWEKVSNAIVNAGSSARWSKLNWNCKLNKLEILNISVFSAANIIGYISISMDDIIPNNLDDDGSIFISKILTNGKTATGKMKIKLMVNYSEPISSPVNNLLLRKRNQTHVTENKIIKPSPSPSKFGVNFIHSIPFHLRIRSITTLELLSIHTLVPNSPCVTLNYGPLNEATDAIKNAGSTATWLNLNLNFLVVQSHHLKINVWSRNHLIGKASLSPQSLVQQSIDSDGNVTIAINIMNDNHISTGRVILNCVYASYDHYIHLKLLNNEPVTDFDKSVSTQITSSNQNYNNAIHSLPVAITILSITLVDLPHVHLLKSNAPRVKLTCDSQIMATSVYRQSDKFFHLGEYGSNAQWKDLNWYVEVYSGSYFVLVISSEDKLIGSLDVHARKLVSIPIAIDGTTELQEFIIHQNHLLNTKIQLVMKIDPLKKILPPNVNLNETLYDSNSLFTLDSSISLNYLSANNLVLLINITKLEVKDIHFHYTSISSNTLRKYNTKDVWISMTYNHQHEASEKFEALELTIHSLSLNWILNLKEESHVHMCLHSHHGIIGSLSITPKTLLTQFVEDDKTSKLILHFYHQITPIAKLFITFSKTVQRNELQIDYSKGMNTRDNVLHVIHEEDDDDNEFKSLQFPLLCHISKVSLTHVNVKMLQRLEQQVKVHHRKTLGHLSAYLPVIHLNPWSMNTLTSSSSSNLQMSSDHHHSEFDTKIYLEFHIPSLNYQCTSQAVFCNDYHKRSSYLLVEDIYLPLEHIAMELTIKVFTKIQSYVHSNLNINPIPQSFLLGKFEITSEDLLAMTMMKTGQRELKRSLIHFPPCFSIGRVGILFTLKSSTIEAIKEQFHINIENQIEETISSNTSNTSTSSSNVITNDKIELEKPSFMKLKESLISQVLIESQQSLGGMENSIVETNSIVKPPLIFPSSPVKVVATLSQSNNQQMITSDEDSIISIESSKSPFTSQSSPSKKYILPEYLIVIRKVLLIDLPSVHLLKKNSPMITISCGNKTIFTSVS